MDHSEVVKMRHVDGDLHSQRRQLLAFDVLVKLQWSEVDMVGSGEAASESVASDRVGDVGTDLEFDFSRPRGRGFEVSGKAFERIGTKLDLPGKVA